MQKSNQSEKYLLIRCIYSTKKKNFVFFLQKQFVKLELQFGRASLDYVSISQKLSSFLAYRYGNKIGRSYGSTILFRDLLNFTLDAFD